MYKGNLKIIVLKELSKKDMSGYSLMKSLAESTGKKPSPGSIYPLLDDLKNHKLVTVKEQGRKKIYSLTKLGIHHAKECQCEEDIHQKLGQTIKMFCNMVDNKEMQQIKTMMAAMEEEAKKGSTKKFTAFKKEMLPFKILLFELAKESDKEKISKARKIIIDATTKLKKL